MTTLVVAITLVSDARSKRRLDADGGRSPSKVIVPIAPLPYRRVAAADFECRRRETRSRDEASSRTRRAAACAGHPRAADLRLSLRATSPGRRRTRRPRDQHRGRGADEHVPGERDRRPSPDAVIVDEPAEHPGKASRSRDRGISVPSRNAPSTAPDANDSTASPASSTERSIHCAPSATPSCTTPQPTVASRDTRISVALVRVGPDVLQIEVVHGRRRHGVQRRRQRRGDDRRDDEAGERRASATLTTKTGRISSLRPSALRQRRLLVVDEQHDADEQEQR